MRPNIHCQRLVTMSLEDQFYAAVKVIRSLPKHGSFQPSNEMKLTFYAYFKQATDGPNTTKKPAFYDLVNRYKWEAWKGCGEMDKEAAMQKYVDELKKVIETINMSSEVASFLDVLGPFYEFLPDSPTKNINNNNCPMSDKMSSIQQEEQVSSSRMFTAYDSDGDEFSDPLDTTFYQDAVSIFATSPQASGSSSTLAALPKSKSNRASAVITPTSSAAISMHENLSLSEQLTVAIFKLQQSCDRLDQRVDQLEQHRQNTSTAVSSATFNKNNPLSILFPDLSTRSTLLLLAWPIVAHFALNYLRTIRKNH